MPEQRRRRALRCHLHKLPLALTLSRFLRVHRRIRECLSRRNIRAASSALNTPELARWSRLSPRADAHQPTIACEAEHASRLDIGVRLVKGSSSPLQDRFPSAYLDPPLLNILPGLSPLKLPQEASSQFGTHDSPPTSPSSLLDSGPALSRSIPPIGREYPAPSRRSSTVLSPSGLINDYFPIDDATPEPSPQLTIASLPTSLYVSDADSLIIPPSVHENLTTTGYHHSTFIQATPSAPDMDAFALAAAVASAASRSSLSIPPSIPSAAGSPAACEEPLGYDASPPYPHMEHSSLVQTPLGHRSRDVPGSEHQDVVNDHGHLMAESWDSSRVRRRSAPPPAVGRTPPPVAAQIVSSRVDVGDRSFTRRSNVHKQPVLGKMRRFGQRIRGLFKSKGESPPRKTIVVDTPAPRYGLMTTTTEVTNVEYQSEHPIPLPSPRAQIMRNHRRSLPLPSVLLPPSADNLASLILKRPAANRSNTSYHPDSTHARPGETQDLLPARQPSPTAADPNTSPHTPKPRRQRIQTAPQAQEREDAGEETNVRRFSLSSALSRSRLEAIRSTVMPRPPLPSMHSRSTRDNVSSSGLSRTTTRRSSLVTRSSVDCASRGTPSGSYWGGELPSVRIIRDSQERSSREESPPRVRTQTAPSGAQASPIPESVPTTPKTKRARRFSLSSMIARRASRSRVATGINGRPAEPEVPAVPDLPPRIATAIGRPRGDTVTTITQGVPFDIVQPRQGLDLPSRPLMLPVASSYRASLAPSVASSHAGSAYFDAREQLSEDCHRSSFEADRSCSPGLESDLDSMSFARTPDYSSGTFSYGSGPERDRYADDDNLSIPGSYRFRSIPAGRCASTSALARLVTESTNAPVTKTLRFSPSLSLSFERSLSDGEEDDLGMMEQEEEERGFMRALGFEFDEIARRAREES
ncbi:hypothetical protein PYCCODRAFT_224226 [Trametes coccinea BRFM310]|uniref:Uncharacterized protein n=1 Tax=Trametes coccinea (strain BRFM310) TaxID=1353009 RepID=A0A1Y2IQX9_TRAC3|nr:hypothetical protein PYCCODRAFT_224226 [Trametes coccinea BRFM310]